MDLLSVIDSYSFLSSLTYVSRANRKPNLDSVCLCQTNQLGQTTLNNPDLCHVGLFYVATDSNT